ncbi:MAG: UDP-N-acetylenolpyruvoylglucosamine reductase [Nitrosomonas sp.]|nr:UDP-N-acetylenolpyruvoylglucosamine reductase [Nitrosomonas sp.]
MIAVQQNVRFAMPVTGETAGNATAPVLRGELRANEPMSRHTSWRTGGCADRYYLPADLDDLANFLRASPHEPLYVIGLGSNLLVRDGGLRGTVVALHARLNDVRLIEQNSSGGLIYAAAGVACAKVARFAAKLHLAGAEFLAGIPGTVGGALAMNAGCYGSETWEIVQQVQVVDRSGQVLIRQPSEYAIGYRSVKRHAGAMESEWFSGAYFRLPPGDQAQARERIKQLLAQRVASQPLDQPNAGSVFRNPPGDHAARLIEACGLKGCCIGGAMVSPKHANFIVNTGNASAADIEALIMMVQSRVKKATGIALVPEVRIIGDARRLT